MKQSRLAILLELMTAYDRMAVEAWDKDDNTDRYFIYRDKKVAIEVLIINEYDK